MKIAALALTGVMTFASVAFGFGLKDTIHCQSKSNVQFNLVLENRPSIELSNYNSAKHKDSRDNGGITSQLLVNRQIFPTQVKSLSVIAGKMTDIYVPRADLFCNIGITETGIRYKAEVTLNGIQKKIDFTCTSESLLPEGAVFCE